MQKGMVALEDLGDRDDKLNPFQQASKDLPVDEVIGIYRMIELVGDHCTQLLRLKYYDGLSDEKIGARMGHRRKWVNKHKINCLNRLKELVAQQGLTLSDFMQVTS